MLAEEIRKITDRLIDGTGATSPPVNMIKDFCDALLLAGVPLWRVGVFVRTLHPDIFGRNFIWQAGTGEVVTRTVDFDIVDSEAFNASALKIVFREGREVRCRIDGPVQFPFLDELRAEGATDYIATPLRFIDGSAHAASWTTRQVGGFSDEQIAAIHAVIPPLTRLIEVVGLRRTASTLLNTYVGARAGERILAGQIRRGHTETMQAAIWLSDLRGFTALSDRLPSESVVEILNVYFDCQVAPILKHGGEVLKFMGDGLLAVFPIAEAGDTKEVCARVLEAATEARANVAALEYAGAANVIERFRFGLALHVGQLLYGNIGGGKPPRLHLHRPGGQPRGAAGKDRRQTQPAPSSPRPPLPLSAAMVGMSSVNFPSPGSRKCSTSTGGRMKPRNCYCEEPLGDEAIQFLRAQLRDCRVTEVTIGPAKPDPVAPRNDELVGPFNPEALSSALGR